METFDILTKVNLWSVVLAGFAYLIIGSLWYSPLLFGKMWVKLLGFCDDDFKSSKPMWMILLLSFLSAAIASFVISAVMGPRSSAEFGAIIGASILPYAGFQCLSCPTFCLKISLLNCFSCMRDLIL